MAQEKLGDSTRAELMELIGIILNQKGYEILVTGSNSYGIPAVEDGEETAVKIVFQIPKGARDGSGYDVYEDAEEYKFKQAQKAEKAKAKAEKEKRKEKSFSFF